MATTNSRRSARKAAPTNPDQRAALGGSYLRQKDGTLVRREFTREPDHPEHAANIAKAEAEATVAVEPNTSQES